MLLSKFRKATASVGLRHPGGSVETVRRQKTLSRAVSHIQAEGQSLQHKNLQTRLTLPKLLLHDDGFTLYNMHQAVQAFRTSQEAASDNPHEPGQERLLSHYHTRP